MKLDKRVHRVYSFVIIVEVKRLYQVSQYPQIFQFSSISLLTGGRHYKNL